MNGSLQPYGRVTFISHFIVGAIGASATLLVVPSVRAFVIFCFALVCVGLATHCAVRYCASCLSQGFELIEQAVVTSEKPPGNSVFHQTAEKLVNHVSRLATAAAKGRDHSREVERVLAAFDRRESSSNQSSSPSRQLSLLLNSLGGQTRSAIDGISLIDNDMQALRMQMVGSSNDEFELVKIAAGEIRNVAKDVAAISEYAKRAKASDVSAAARSEAVSRQLLDLQHQLAQLRDQVGAYDRKSLSLRSQMSEVASLVQTIYEYSAKTDTMALNASIESVRAGEHGLAFSAAADEIRKMTSIISDSTSEALERLKLVDDGVSDTTAMCAQRNSTVEGQMITVRELCEGLSEIRQSTSDSRQYLDKLLETNDKELRNLNVIANALGGVFESAERAASRFDEELRIRSQFHDRLAELSTLLSPLTGAIPKSEPKAVSSDSISLVAADDLPPIHSGMSHA